MRSSNELGRLRAFSDRPGSRCRYGGARGSSRCVGVPARARDVFRRGGSRTGGSACHRHRGVVAAGGSVSREGSRSPRRAGRGSPTLRRAPAGRFHDGVAPLGRSERSSARGRSRTARCYGRGVRRARGRVRARDQAVVCAVGAFRCCDPTWVSHRRATAPFRVRARDDADPPARRGSYLTVGAQRAGRDACEESLHLSASSPSSTGTDSKLGSHSARGSSTARGGLTTTPGAVAA